MAFDADRRARSTSFHHPQPFTQLAHPPSTATHTRRNSAGVSIRSPATSSSTATAARRTPTSSCNSTPRARTRSSSAASLSAPFLFTPSTPPVIGPRSKPHTRTSSPPLSISQRRHLPTTKSRSSPHLPQHVPSPSHTASFLAQYSPPRVATVNHAESESEQEEDDAMIYTAKKLGQGGPGFRTRFLGKQPKGITTTPGQLGAGETETETDEPVSLPYASFRSYPHCV
ncbi:hypothetical protein BV25DRAFT_140327 [Artomyces pyxidatus]|uniref:Uncharacterized protein n=1 Tax=Artomyces pyxidatus TaxID=48021 RepID=A0ACB8TAD9_9AGAM|nr:hypothetical protein BV25DRAFT_140327 [Artomyces pyxidatus]